MSDNYNTVTEESLRNGKIIIPDFEARDFLIVHGGGGCNNRFIATDDNEAIS